MGKSLDRRDERRTCGPAPYSILLLIGKDLSHLMFDLSEELFGVSPVRQRPEKDPGRFLHIIRVSADSVESNELGFDKAAKSVLGVMAVPEENTSSPWPLI